MNRPGQPPLRLLMVAGESSADRYGEQLIRSLRDRCDRIEGFGIGGERMRSVGFRTLYDSKDLGVVGLVEVLARLPLYFRVLRDLRRRIDADPPDLAILIDYPDFNLRLARHLKRRRVPVLYFISPQVWAWRKKRVRAFASRIDTMAVILPFEEEIYRSEGVNVEYVGHPLLDLARPSRPREETRRQMGISPGEPVVGLLPGSRKTECQRILPVLLEAAEKVHDRNRSLRFILPLASTLSRQEVERELGRHRVPITLVEGDYYDALNLCDAAVIASGTATLEAALLEVPMVIVYRLHPLTYWIGSRLATIDMIGLVNLIAGRRVVPELVQGGFTPDTVAAELEKLLNDQSLQEKIRRDLREVRGKLGSKGAFPRTADIAMRLVAGRFGAASDAARAEVGS